MANLPFRFKRPEDSPGFLLWQTTMTWQRLIKRSLEPSNVTHPQFVILALLLWFEEHQIETTQILIAKWSKLDKMTVSKSLKDLVVRALVQRSEHEIDTRAKRVILTDKGRALVYELVPIVEGIDSDFFGKASISEQESLIAILSKLTASPYDV